MIEPAVETKPVGQRVGGYHARYFEPVDDELDTVDLPVRGQIPPELDGAYVRNGPNAQFPATTAGGTPTTATGCSTSSRSPDRRARYRNRYVLTRDLVAERQVGSHAPRRDLRDG